MPALVIMSSLVKSIANIREPPWSSSIILYSNADDDLVSRKPLTRTIASCSSVVASTSMVCALPTLADADDDDRDVVGSAPLVREGDQRVARRLRVGVGLAHVLEELVVGGQTVESIGT